LQPYLGKFVKVQYTRIDKEAGVLSMIGTVIGRIENISVLANTPDELPLVVTARSRKAEYAPDTPIEVSVVITNRSTTDQTLRLGSSYTALCQDYQRKYVLEPDGHYLSLIHI